MEETRKERPSLLRVLLILSFIGGSWSVMTGLSKAFSEPSMERLDTVNSFLMNLDDGSTEGKLVQEAAYEFNENLNMNIKNNGVFEFMFYSISLIGVFLMYQKRRVGFFVYSIAQILIIINPILFGGYNLISVGVTFFYAFLSMLFMALYSPQLKYLE